MFRQLRQGKHRRRHLNLLTHSSLPITGERIHELEMTRLEEAEAKTTEYPGTTAHPSCKTGRDLCTHTMSEWVLKALSQGSSQYAGIETCSGSVHRIRLLPFLACTLLATGGAVKS